MREKTEGESEREYKVMTYLNFERVVEGPTG